MEDNIYQTPQADLSTGDDSDATYYIVSTKKFLTLFISTLGIYGVYWFYKNWSLHKASTNSKIWPVMRGIFAIFFTHSLFRLVNDTLKSKSITHEWKFEFIATIYVISAVLSNVSDRLSAKEIGSPLTNFIGFLFLGTMAWALYKAQIAINMSCNDPEGLSNSNFSAANITWIVLGAALWGLIFVGMTSFV